MLITDEFTWNLATFEDYVEGMCRQIEAFPHERVAFWAPSTPEVILTLFACWKTGKIACPLSPRLPSAEPLLKELETALFTPSMPEPETPRSTQWDPSKLGVFLLTSGSTGRPKIAVLSLGTSFRVQSVHFIRFRCSLRSMGSDAPSFSCGRSRGLISIVSSQKLRTAQL
jgi:acyl-CoA synthetase (AMP-forming)/AMP-acid ligase II